MYIRLNDRLKFTTQRKDILQTTKLDEEQPGSILHDFDVMLSSFRGKQEVLTDAHQLPLKWYVEINQRVKHPIQLALKRPHPKSYPHIQGLYLLLRASGLTRVDVSGKKAVLIVDEAAYQQWSQMNPTERYFTLLETWFLRGYADLIGEYSRTLWDLPDNFDHLGMFLVWYGRDLENWLQVAGNRDVNDRLQYSPGRHNLGLLDLFGLIDVESGSPGADGRWHIEKIRFSPFGGALLALLYTEFFNETIHLLGFKGEDETETLIEKFQRLLQHYFPEWRNRFTPPQPAFQDGTHIYKVSLNSRIWRRIAIDAKHSLDKLAAIILQAFDFDHDHLYDFQYRNPFGRMERVNHPYMDEGIFTTEVSIGEVPIAVGQNMVFTFDYGDNWKFAVLLEAIEPHHIKKPKILESHGEAPEQYPDTEDYDFIVLGDFDFDVNINVSNIDDVQDEDE